MSRYLFTHPLRPSRGYEFDASCVEVAVGLVLTNFPTLTRVEARDGLTVWSDEARTFVSPEAPRDRRAPVSPEETKAAARRVAAFLEAWSNLTQRGNQISGLHGTHALTVTDIAALVASVAADPDTTKVALIAAEWGRQRG